MRAFDGKKRNVSKKIVLISKLFSDTQNSICIIIDVYCYNNFGRNQAIHSSHSVHFISYMPKKNLYICNIHFRCPIKATCRWATRRCWAVGRQVTGSSGFLTQSQ